MKTLCWLDDTPVEFDELETLEPALTFLGNIGGNVTSAQDKLLRDVIGEDGYDALREYPVTEEELEEAIRAVQVAIFGTHGASVASEYGWVVDHLDDIHADFLRFYRLDYRTLPASEFFSLASRLGAYGGVISSRLKAEQINSESDTEPERDDDNTYLRERLG